MNITKDEARIFWASLEEIKYNLVEDFEKTKAVIIINEINILQNYLMNMCIDKRRNGRSSHDSFNDLLKRYKCKHTIKN